MAPWLMQPITVTTMSAGQGGWQGEQAGLVAAAMVEGVDPETAMGPLVSCEQHQRVAGFLQSGREEGAEFVTGDSVVGNRGYFVEPTVLARANRGMKVVREEMFGPMVCVQSFKEDDLDRIATFANDTEYGLAASI